jgi:hypothetical protein
MYSMLALRLPLVLTTALIATACASAGDRFKDGTEAEGAGNYYRAAMRYVDALEKDETMVEAKDRLLIAGDSAIITSLRTIDGLLGVSDPVAAGEEFLALDRLLSAAEDVGVNLPTPAEFTAYRRGTLDGAITELMARATDLQTDGAWGRSRSTLSRIPGEFQPNPEQLRVTREAESWLLMDWAADEEAMDRFRRAFGLAVEAVDVIGAPDEVVDRAIELQGRALEFGTRFVAVFPITKTPELRGQGEEDLAVLLSDLLDLQHWQEPPGFIAIADPVLIRRLTRRYTPRGMPLRPLRIMGEVGADYGVLIEIDRFTRTERDVRRRERASRTRRDSTVTYYEESGTQRYDIRARVIILDARGREVDDFFVSRNKSGSFERGVYEGDLRELKMSRNQQRLFDRVRQAQARAELEGRLVSELSKRLGDQLFGRILRRIP